MSRAVRPILSEMFHVKCRNSYYQSTNNTVQRFPVPDNKVKWDAEFDEYKPVDYTDKKLIGRSYADPDVKQSNFHPLWHFLDGQVNRASFCSLYEIVDGKPRNPVGRTGVTGRGVLGRWGPNHAADPIVTRWKRLPSDEIQKHSVSGEPILQFVGIERKDCGEWALPGGMVDAFEVVQDTLKREFMEEALNSLELADVNRGTLKENIDRFFNDGTTIYEGYVDDPRNTDNAWMETVAANFHDPTGKTIGFKLNAGDDAAKVKWIDISRDLKLYASHADFIASVTHERKAHW